MSEQSWTSAGLSPRTAQKPRRFPASRALRNNLIAVPFILFTITSCGDSGPTGPGVVAPPEDLVLPSSSIEVDQGSVGLVINARAIARRGYRPATAQVDFSFPGGSVSEELVFDSLTNVAVLTLPANELTEEAIDKLHDGVDVTIQVFDKLSKELTSHSDIVRVNSSNIPLLVDADHLPAIYPELQLGEGVPYFAQAITNDPNARGRTFRHLLSRNPLTGSSFGRISLEPFDPSADRMLYLHDIGPDLFRITMHPPDFNAPVYLEMMDEAGIRFLGSSWETDPARVGAARFAFALARDEDGLVRITPLGRNPLAYINRLLQASNSPQAHLPVRIVAANIAWSVDDLGTTFSPPITPPARLEFAYKSTLRNCSNATLTETVGRSETRTQAFTVGTQESLQLFSSHQASVNVTASAQAGFNFFGAGATASVKTEAGYTYTTSSTSSTTNTWERTVTDIVEVARERTVVVPRFTVVEVYDAIQSVENVRMPFVQRLRIRGSYDGTTPLSGEEITSQLLANQFGGVVTRVGGQFVDITTQGSVTIHAFYEAQSRVIEIENACRP